jgi:hypothetical protein
MNTIEKEFVPYELAVKLKKLRFDQPCLICYDKLEMIASHSKNVFDYKNYNSSGYMVSRPTFSQAFRWFREKYGLCIVIKPIHDKNLELGYNLINNELIIRAYTTYEKAELACLEKLIEIVEQQNQK